MQDLTLHKVIFRKRTMRIRWAEEKDLEGINRLLFQVNAVHHEGRPDLFKAGAKKYTDAQLLAILKDEETPVFAAVDENDALMGYAFCIFVRQKDNNILEDMTTLYIDDLCVDENLRGRHVGRALYDAVLAFAREQGCYNVTLNVWTCNENAMRFYEACGLKQQKVGMEVIL